MPAPGEAPCAEARTTTPTDDSTDALQAADGGVPDGMLKDTDTVSTTVVGGMGEADALSEDVTLLERESEFDTVVLTLSDGVGSV